MTKAEVLLGLFVLVLLVVQVFLPMLCWTLQDRTLAKADRAKAPSRMETK
jgi:hypothetical protein